MSKVPRILAVLLCIAIFVAVSVNHESVKPSRKSDDWNLSCDNMAVRKATLEEIPQNEVNTENFYMITGDITNNSVKPVRLDLDIEMGANTDVSYAVRLYDPISDAVFDREIEIPVGCTAHFEHMFRARKEDMQDNQVYLIVGNYGTDEFRFPPIELPE